MLTYAVEFKSENDSDFRRINEYDNIFLSYHVVGGILCDFRMRTIFGISMGKLFFYIFDTFFLGPNDEISGEYRVAGVDYWHRRGLFSEILKVVATPSN